MSDEPVAVMVTKGALCEVGRPDLADGVAANKHGMPCRRGGTIIATDDRLLVTRAATLGHRAAGHDAEVRMLGDDVPYVECRDCDDIDRRIYLP